MDRGIRRFLHRMHRPFSSLTSRASSNHRLLFACHNALMARHLRPVYDAIAPEPNIEAFIVIPGALRKKSPEDLPIIRNLLPARPISEWKAYLRRWSLVVVADHGYFDALTEAPRQRVVHVGHGSPSKVLNGEALPYEYGSRARDRRGRPRYERFFEASHALREQIEAADPAFKSKITVVGRAEDEALLEKSANRGAIREQMGLDPNQILVFTTSTWGPDSLFQVLGDEFFEESKKLAPQFQFALSTHPLEYRKPDANGKLWGPYLLTYRDKGFIVREPQDDFKDLLIASDVILTDHTALAHKAALLRKPAVYIPVDRSLYWEGGITDRYIALSPVLENAMDLESRLRQALSSYPRDALADLSLAVNSHPGEYQKRTRAAIFDLLSEAIE